MTFLAPLHLHHFVPASPALNSTDLSLHDCTQFT